MHGQVQGDHKICQEYMSAACLSFYNVDFYCNKSYRHIRDVTVSNLHCSQRTTNPVGIPPCKRCRHWGPAVSCGQHGEP